MGNTAAAAAGAAIGRTKPFESFIKKLQCAAGGKQSKRQKTNERRRGVLGKGGGGLVVVASGIVDWLPIYCAAEQKYLPHK